jgi:PleD family two-component response regulator
MRQRVRDVDCSAYAPGWTLSVSGGVAERGDAVRYETLVARADALLYEAKRAGRNRIVG